MSKDRIVALQPSRPTATATAFMWIRPWFETQQVVEFRQSLLNRIHGLEFNLKDFHEASRLGQCKINIRDATEDEVNHVVAHTRIGAKKLVALDLLTEDFDLDELCSGITSSDGNEIALTERQDLAKYFIASEASSSFNAVLTIWNICYFGCVDTLHTLEKFNGRIMGYTHGCSFRVASIFDDLSTIKGKFVSAVDPINALGWSRDCKGFWEGDAETRVQKAVACLARTSSDHAGKSTYDTLLWSLAGLEALFCENESSIIYQIKRRAPLLLRKFEIENLIQEISKGYNFRSRLFHGDVKIRSPFADGDTGFDDEKHHETQASHYADFFCLLLHCSILACVESNTQDISFSEVCDVSVG